ncbi:class I SAM-dependent methyltransferase [Parasphingorhabdus cellanae]|uniref:Class I SAM-dependent methyltransferase n=1 Tax=Parasphingorhabdus cellanae TaxID=2806553 RepID=A0ABX7TAQ1_9SPHN|nr:class I SAM-dependent methyltransferase [Parasphingorhabdus cellanae]QTD57313.1 class I SAM-dependent methyltransferase [Parasphingorhabdus cellanae]
MADDMSNGYNAIAEEFIAVRSEVGRIVVMNWAATLPAGGSIVDVGAGSGEPLTSVLIDSGLVVSAIDASPKMVRAFRRRFQGVEVACEAAERSSFFDQTFDAILAVGLVFLLPPDRQYELFSRMTGALKREGRMLFSAPHQVCTWDDVLTGRRSWSLGEEEYGHILTNCGLQLTNQLTDEGGTHYFEAQKASS